MAHFQSQRGEIDRSIGAILQSTPDAPTD